MGGARALQALIDAANGWDAEFVQERFGVEQEEFESEFVLSWDYKAAVPLGDDVLASRAAVALERPASFPTKHSKPIFQSYLTLVVLLHDVWHPDPIPLANEAIGEALGIGEKTASNYRQYAVAEGYLRLAARGKPHQKADTFWWAVEKTPADFDDVVDPPDFDGMLEPPAPAGDAAGDMEDDE